MEGFRILGDFRLQNRVSFFLAGRTSLADSFDRSRLHIAEYLSRDRLRYPGEPGLRLLGVLAPGLSAAEINETISLIESDEGYRAHGRYDVPFEFASISLWSRSFRQSTPDVDIRGPLPLVTDGLSLRRAGIEDSRAVRRGLVVAGPRWRDYGLSFTAEVVRRHSQDWLALEFFSSRQAELRWVGGELRDGTVYLPLNGQSPANVFDSFVAYLVLGFPIDTAAWGASFSNDAKPLVIASDLTLDFWAYMRSRHYFDLGGDASASMSASRPAPDDLAAPDPSPPSPDPDLLSESYIDDGAPPPLASHSRATSFLRRGFAAAVDLGKSLILRTFDLALPTSVETASAPMPTPEARYTDVKITDATTQQELSDDTPLVTRRSYGLDVAIRRIRTGLSAASAEQNRIELFGQSRTETLWVVVTEEKDDERGAGLFILERRFGRLRIPVEGDSEGSCTFQLTPSIDAASRTGRLAIRIYRRLTLVDHLVLQARVVADPTEVVSGKAIELEFRRPGTGGIEPLTTETEGRMLTIGVDQTPGGAYRFSIISAKDDAGEPALYASRVLSEAVLNGFVAEFRAILLDTAFGPSLPAGKMTAEELDTVIRRLSLLGTKIVNALFDVQKADGDMFELGELIRSALPDLAMVQISLSKGATEFTFPWQILTINDVVDKDAPVDIANLWGWRYILEVKRCGDGVGKSHEQLSSDACRIISYARWNFANEAYHFQRLQDLVAQAAIKSKLGDALESRQDFIRSLREGADLFYVYAHGRSSVPKLPSCLEFQETARRQIAALQKRREESVTSEPSPGNADDWTELCRLYLSATEDGSDSVLTLALSEVPLQALVSHRSDEDETILLRNGPIVFLNTCQSAQVWNGVESSFVGFFLSRGANAVLGTETTIPVVVAELFGRSVLAGMLAGKTLGEAVQAARKELLTESGSMLGLCYTIYGAADARLGMIPR